jgi:GNAT superfamily N-acetyltransferase
MAAMDVRPADESELDRLAQVWFDSWRDAHAAILPAELTKLRTLDSFRRRLGSYLPDLRAVGPRGAPVGFYILKGDELYQLFVAAEARGTGAAVALIDDAEARLAAKGVGVAWLACAIGNERAARFYEKRGWRRTGTVVTESELDVSTSGAGGFRLEVWRYEKPLIRRG